MPADPNNRWFDLIKGGDVFGVSPEKIETTPTWPEGCQAPNECRTSGFCEYDRCPHGAELVLPAEATSARVPPAILHGGLRAGRAWAMAQDVKALLAKGKRVVTFTKGECAEIVGVVDDPNTQLLEDRSAKDAG